MRYLPSQGSRKYLRGRERISRDGRAGLIARTQEVQELPAMWEAHALVQKQGCDTMRQGEQKQGKGVVYVQ